MGKSVCVRGKGGITLAKVARVMYECICVAIYIVVSNLFSDVEAKIPPPSK